MEPSNKKIIGVLPVGGNAVRLGLPGCLSKCMLPQAGQDKYIPVVCHTIQKMKEAGATEIYFIHAKGEYKSDITGYFDETGYFHIQQRKDNFANTLLSSIHHYLDKDLDKDTRILYGLPDTVYVENPYRELAKGQGVTMALFEAENELKVDRLNTDKGGEDFDIKSSKKETNSTYFWGSFALDFKDLSAMIESKRSEADSEIGKVLNKFGNKIYYYYGHYLDLGIWSNMNKYWQENKSL